MKISYIALAALLAAAAVSVPNYTQAAPAPAVAKDQAAADKVAADCAAVAAKRVAILKLNDPEKEARLTEVIKTHLIAVHDWHQEHGVNFATLVPKGVDPGNGMELNDLHRQFIADSAIPKSVHKALVEGLKKDLTQDQIDVVFEDYSEPGRPGGKVKFTMDVYPKIVAMDEKNPKLSPEEYAQLLSYLRQAAEMSADYKGSKLISQCFEIYKTKCEQYLATRGHDWHTMYGAFTKSLKAAKPAAAPAQ